MKYHVYKFEKHVLFKTYNTIYQPNRKILKYSLFLLIASLFFSCRKDKVEDVGSAFDIILLMGQSNTHYGDDSLNSPKHDHPLIFQLSRDDFNDQQIIPAVEPLDNHTKANGKVGFALTFAELYLKSELAADRKLLLIPCGHINSGFYKNDWDKGGKLFEDAVIRYRTFVKKNPQSKIVATLWHQGEADVKNTNYKNELDLFITDFRMAINAPNSPFILGGMVPYWVEKDQKRQATQTIIAETPERIENTAYADPYYPFVIHKAIDSINSIHYDALGLNELGKRYFSAYLEIKD